ncbi:MAG: DUF4221 domain-containing protein [Bacteroides sp.]|jgi:hypothetical protein|nr:DUF4221 domain-containing protein [Bacteroides sp.]MCI1682557.1 DUF4221 domain-containing protein [Bacteroides sp.]
MKYILCILWLIFLFESCANKNETSYSLRPSDCYLSYPIDEDTRLPTVCLWTFKENGHEYLAFDNQGTEILLYDMQSQKMIKKVRFEKEGSNGIGNINSFFIKDFHHIYIPSPSDGLYVTDTTAVIKQHIRFSDFRGKDQLVRFFSRTSNYTPICFLHNGVYISQPVNPMLNVEYVDQNPVGALLDSISGMKIVTPLKYHSHIPVKNLPHYVRGTLVSCCFDGSQLIYSFDSTDSLFTLSADFRQIKAYYAKSRYISKVKIESIQDVDFSRILKKNCEDAAYGNILYDKYRKVYYRFAYPQTEMDGRDVSKYLDILHWGSKSFSIIILDKNFQVIGETKFSDFTYNSRMFFIREDGLYLSVTHFKRPDFNESVLRFQRIDLVK